jgi:hypothetical protein
MRLFLSREDKEKLEDFDIMKNRNLQLLGDAAELLILAKGCDKHPSYRAHRKPSAECPQCNVMFLAMQNLLLAGYVALRGKKPGKKAKV